MLFVLAVLLGPSTAWAAPWWDCQWHYRTEVSVQTNRAANDRAVSMQLSSANFNSAYVFTLDGADLRVLDSDNITALDFHVDSWDAATSTALITVRFPTLRPNTPRTVYVYYGNALANSNTSAVQSISNAPTTYTSSGWRYHTRPSNLNPNNEAQARSGFDNARDRGRYGCTTVDQVQGRTNQNTFNGSGSNFGLLAETFFEVTIPGVWNFRSGVDFGRGGAVYIDGVPITERWNEDLWWGNNYNNADVLTGSVNLDIGYHHYETLGFEGCCDGPITVQYLSPGSSVWQELSSTNLNLVNAGCPVGTQSFQVVQTDAPNQFAGLAFIDNGDNGISHNALLEGNESGVAGIDVTIEIVNSGISKLVTTESSGRWQTCFFEDAIDSDVQISVPLPVDHYLVSESTSVANSDLALNGILRFPVVADTQYLDLATGFITQPKLLSDNAINVGAGVSGLLPHRYTPSSDSVVSFQISQLLQQPQGVYTYEVFQDLNCDGELDSPAVPLVSSIAAQVGQDVCMVVKVDGTASVNESSLLELRVDATTDFTGIDLSHANTNTDSIIGVTAVLMTLNKTTCNASARVCDIASGGGFTTDVTGKPADEIVYRLEFVSVNETLSNVAVLDNIPPYTKLKPASISVVSQPPGMNCTIVEPLDQTLANFTGTVKWQCNGQVEASQSGVVAFSVLID